MAQLDRLRISFACGLLAVFSIAAAPATRPAEARDELAELRQRNAELEERLTNLEQRIGELQRQLDDLRRRQVRSRVVPDLRFAPPAEPPATGPRPSRPDPRRNWIEREHNGLKYYLIPLKPAAEPAPPEPAR